MVTRAMSASGQFVVERVDMLLVVDDDVKVPRQTLKLAGAGVRNDHHRQGGGPAVRCPEVLERERAASALERHAIVHGEDLLYQLKRELVPEQVHAYDDGPR